jgi:hypothetical protein
MSEQTAERHSHENCFCCEASESIGSFIRSVLPSAEAVNHFRQARIEVLKGFRRIIDDRIDRLGRNQPKGTKVTVE